MRIREDRRRGAQLVEAAIILPILMSILLGMIIGAAGVFSNNQVAMLAREGARWAAVHGPTYASETGQPVANSQTVLAKGVLPMAAGMNQPALSCNASFNASQTVVTVNVSYQWSPLMIFPSMTMASTSVMPVTY